MPISSALAACVLVVSSHYGVPRLRLQGMLDQQPAGASIGAAHIPAIWSPVLARYGFDLKTVHDNPCQSIAAAGWVLRYMVEVEQIHKNISQSARRAAPWAPIINAYAKDAGVDPRLVMAVIAQESGFNPTAVSPAGAYGLMQLTAPTAKTLGVNRYDVRQNLWGGIWYLAELQRYYGGNLALTLAAYNAGPGAVAHWHGIPPYRETLAYVPSVLRHYTHFLDVAQVTPAAAPPILGDH